jgi:hypothetical protein
LFIVVCIVIVLFEPNSPHYSLHTSRRSSQIESELIAWYSPGVLDFCDVFMYNEKFMFKCRFGTLDKIFAVGLLRLMKTLLLTWSTCQGLISCWQLGNLLALGLAKMSWIVSVHVIFR